MAVIENLGKFAHLILVQYTNKIVHIYDIFMRELFRLHGLPKIIVSKRDVKFTFSFWNSLFNRLGTQV